LFTGGVDIAPGPAGLAGAVRRAGRRLPGRRVAHYTGQAELAGAIQEGLEAS
jgi:hypothetical protein